VVERVYKGNGTYLSVVANPGKRQSRAPIKGVAAVVIVVVGTGCMTPSPAPTPTLEPFQNSSQVFYSNTVGDYYTIYVDLPGNYDPDGPQYPVIFLLDADWYFDGSHKRIDNGGVKGIVHRLCEKKEMPEVILVGIGYPGEIQRGRDFLVSFVHFYALLKDELLPFIDSTYNTASEGRTLIGHSDGGFFTLYALFRYDPSDTVFTNFISISGDFSKVDRYLFTEEISLYNRLGSVLPVTLYLAVGSEEEERFIASHAEMTENLKGRDYTGFVFKSKKYYGLHHGSVVSPAIEDGLKWIFLNAGNGET
jgi:predicted alpha/beta superfamily hydrolase